MAKCGYCTFLDPDKVYESYNKKFWCEENHEWKYADEESCWRYCKAYSRSDYVAESLINASRESQSSSGCYLTTITCFLLGYADNNEYLQKLRKFRNEVMQKDPKYFELLAQYDIVGPIIASRLCRDSARGMIAKNLLELGIKVTVKHIDDKNYEEAVKTYTTMTELLIEGCKIKTEEPIIKEYAKNMEVEKAGHGKVMIKQKPSLN